MDGSSVDATLPPTVDEECVCVCVSYLLKSINMYIVGLTAV